MDSLDRSTLCPVCGFDLGFEPWRGDSASDEYCPSCGIQFGYHDVTEACGMEGTREELQLQWREKWISHGMLWSIPEIPPPPDWNPRTQLKRIGVEV
jgi:hypothetical protein